MVEAVTLPPIVGLDDIQTDLERLILCDVRWYLDGRSGPAAYEAGHIPGAVFISLDDDLSDASLGLEAGRHPLPSPEVFASRLGARGISRADAVVAYDDGNGGSAGRLVWMLRAIGHDAALLDGGLASWPGQYQAGQTTLPPVTYEPVPWPADRLADAAELSGGGQPPLFDVRASERFRGEAEPIDPRAGHIPGAQNLPMSGNSNAAGRFFDREQLASRFQGVGISAEGDSVVYCGSGVSACQTLLAIEHAGLGRQRLYPGSWSAWSRDETREIATGEN